MARKRQQNASKEATASSFSASATAPSVAVGTQADAERAALTAFIRALARDAARADHAETPRDD
jgi:hypothetical protein